VFEPASIMNTTNTCGLFEAIFRGSGKQSSCLNNTGEGSCSEKYSYVTSHNFSIVGFEILREPCYEDSYSLGCDAVYPGDSLPTIWFNITVCLFLAGCLLGLRLGLADVGNMFLRNIGKFLADNTVFHRGIKR
jgi:hypothetical protein